MERILSLYHTNFCYLSSDPALLFIFQLDRISDQRDKFRVCGLPFPGAYRVAEQLVQCIQFSPAPGHLDGMADRPLHPARGGLIFFATVG